MPRPSAIPTPIKLSTKETAHKLGADQATLRRWRALKKGPPYHREVGRIYYYRDELEAWKESTKWA